jgi:hypothetical protein
MELCATWAFALTYLSEGSLHTTLLVCGSSDGLDYVPLCLTTRFQAYHIHSEVATIKDETDDTKVLFYASQIVAEGMERVG